MQSLSRVSQALRHNQRPEERRHGLETQLSQEASPIFSNSFGSNSATEIIDPVPKYERLPEPPAIYVNEFNTSDSRRLSAVVSTLASSTPAVTFENVVTKTELTAAEIRPAAKDLVSYQPQQVNTDASESETEGLLISTQTGEHAANTTLPDFDFRQSLRESTIEDDLDSALTYSPYQGRIASTSSQGISTKSNETETESETLRISLTLRTLASEMKDHDKIED